MDQNQLIEKIVAEVVARMGAKAPGAGGAPLQARSIRVSTMPARTVRTGEIYRPHHAAARSPRRGVRQALPGGASSYRFYWVCVNSCRVAYVAQKLQGTGVKVCSVVGFPLGSMTSRSKAFETREAIADGASEIDMVINVGLAEVRVTTTPWKRTSARCAALPGPTRS